MPILNQTEFENKSFIVPNNKDKFFNSNQFDRYCKKYDYRFEDTAPKAQVIGPTNHNLGIGYDKLVDMTYIANGQYSQAGITQWNNKPLWNNNALPYVYNGIDYFDTDMTTGFKNTFSTGLPSANEFTNVATGYRLRFE